MSKRARLFSFLFFVVSSSLTFGQGPTAAPPRLIDAHLHHNGDPAFLDKVVAKLGSVEGLAFILTTPNDLGSVQAYVARYPNRLIGFGDIKLDDPQALELVDRFHAAGFRGLGEFSGPSIPADISVDRMRPTMLDNIARRFPKLTVIGAHLGNPDYAWAAEIARWNPNLYFDLSGSSLIKKQNDYTFFKSIFWWSGVVSPHTPAGGPDAFEKLVFGSDVFNGELEEFDRELERYHKMLDACGVPAAAQANIFASTLWRILERKN